MRTTPAHLPASDRRHAQANPILLAKALEWRRRALRLLAHRGWSACSLLTGVVIAVLLAVAAVGTLRVHRAQWLTPLLAHELSASAVAAALAWAAIARVRRNAEERLAQSWLASAPVSVRHRRVAVRSFVAGYVGLPVLAVFVVIASAAFATGAPVLRLLGLPAAGFAVGAAAGWRSGSKPVKCRPNPLPRLRPARASTSLAATLTPLARWPFAQWRAGANPVIEVRLIGALLLGLPHGVPPLTALLLLALGAVSLAAFALLRATVVMIPQAADWLRATPLRAGLLVRSACLRAGAWQIAFAALGGALLCVLGAATGLAFVVAAMWLGLCVTASASALDCRHQPSRLALELFGLVALLLAIARIAAFALALVLPVLWAWQIIRLRRT